MRTSNNKPGALSVRPLRILRMLILILVAAYFGIVLYSGLLLTYLFTVPLKSEVCCFDIPHEDMTFKTADGLKLSGWYIPPKNGAVIILLHAYSGTRLWTVPVAQMLIRHGYGVLMYDQRASGESEGDVRSFGWLDVPDVSAAVSWLQSQPGVDKTHIGVYGCSIGGAIALGAGARGPSIAAVAADAPSPTSFDEGIPGMDDPILAFKLPVYMLYFSFISLRSQTVPLLSSVQAAQAISPRPLLLISSGEPGERQRVDRSYNAAGNPKSHWNIPQASHCSGPFASPVEYEQHLTDFFAGAFLK